MLQYWCWHILLLKRQVDFILKFFIIMPIASMVGGKHAGIKLVDHGFKSLVTPGTYLNVWIICPSGHITDVISGSVCGCPKIRMCLCGIICPLASVGQLKKHPAYKVGRDYMAFSIGLTLMSFWNTWNVCHKILNHNHIAHSNKSTKSTNCE